MLKAGEILHFGKPQDITSRIEGFVWECVIPSENAEAYVMRLNVSNLRNMGNGHTILRVVSDQAPTENAVHVKPCLEDLYLFYFKREGEQ